MSENVKNRTITKDHVVKCAGYRIQFVYQFSAHIYGLGAQFLSIDGQTQSRQVMLRFGHLLLTAHWHLERWADGPNERRDSERASRKRRRCGRW